MNTKKIDPRFKAVIDRIIKATTPILEESLVNEISSTLYYDAADAARSYNGGEELANRFRSRAIEVEADELSNRTDDFYEEIVEPFTIGNKQFVIGKYIPTNIYVLLLFKGLNEKSRVAIARIARDKIVPINNESIIADIVSVYNISSNPISSAQTLSSFSKAFTPSSTKKKTEEHAIIERNYAKELAAEIKKAVGADISWRYFFDGRASIATVRKSRKKDSYFTVTPPKPVKSEKAPGEIFVATLVYGKNRDWYTIFYFYLYDGEHKSFVRIYRTEKGYFVFGCKQTNPLYDRLLEVFPEDMRGKERPSTRDDDSNILNSYKWLNKHDPRLVKSLVKYMQDILRYDGRFNEDRLTWNNQFEKAYNTNANDASELIKKLKAEADISDVVVSEPQGDYDDDEDVDDD